MTRATTTWVLVVLLVGVCVLSLGGRRRGGNPPTFDTRFEYTNPVNFLIELACDPYMSRVNWGFAQVDPGTGQPYPDCAAAGNPANGIDCDPYYEPCAPLGECVVFDPADTQYSGLCINFLESQAPTLRVRCLPLVGLEGIWLPSNIRAFDPTGTNTCP